MTELRKRGGGGGGDPDGTDNISDKVRRLPRTGGGEWPNNRRRFPRRTSAAGGGWNESGGFVVGRGPRTVARSGGSYVS